jgi:hypothetical protein
VNHIGETDLALLSGGDAGRFQRYSAMRHLRGCADCRQRLTAFEQLRTELPELDLPHVNWSALASEMRANIHLGLEAGECVRPVSQRRDWTIRFAAAGACIVVLAAAGFFLEDTRPRGFGFSGRGVQAVSSPLPAPYPDVESQTPVLESNGSGIELRTGARSLTLLNHGAVSNQTVNAQGVIRARYIDGETGAVTINNVYLE